MKIKRMLAAFMVLMLVILTVAAAGCAGKSEKAVTGKQSENKEKVLVYGAEFEYDKVNPVLATTNVDNLIFTGLTKFNEKNEVIPDLAESWSISSDGLTYTFKLRKDVKWHDGQPFNAGDVKFTLDTILDPRTNTPVKSEFEQVKEVKVIDDYTVELKLAKPFPPLLDKLSIGIVPKHLLEGKDINSADFNNNPVGTGPFKFKEWQRGKAFTVVANDSFYNGRPKLDKVIFKFLPDPNVRALQLETGEIDLAYLEPDQLERMQKVDRIKVYQVPTADYRVMMYNMKSPLWQDVRVRKAVNYAIDRQAVLDGILKGKGQVAYGPLQLSWANNPNVTKYDYDLNKAKALLAEAGWKPGPDGILVKNGKKFEFKITCPVTDPVRVSIANALVTELKKIGIAATPEPLDWSVIKIPECEAFILGWGSPFDPDDHTYKLFHSSQIANGGNNHMSYRNPKVDKLLEEARTTVDKNKRKELYGQFQQELANDPPYNFIVYLDALYGVNKNITGIKTRTLGHHGAGFLWNIEEWDKQ
ncbi:ABC transporter substrate-binding protein [Thermincola potens]|uniref:Extracellular solute-binding protein family 5 n=1 Tax=Thermincola potens (strain JR) TaxID=635013 RepID=D5XEM3_THEPJ|nr:ABC transporter substrate-binding protein [Thermincola potens]ADG82094.1 extracellular solute-binding protein family 5 [Thermincola potens JR]